MLVEGLAGKAEQLCKPSVAARDSEVGRRAGRWHNPWQEPLIIIIPSKEKVHGSLRWHVVVVGHVGLG